MCLLVFLCLISALCTKAAEGIQGLWLKVTQAKRSIVRAFGTAWTIGFLQRKLLKGSGCSVSSFGIALLAVTQGWPVVRWELQTKLWGLHACKVFLIFNQQRKILPSWEMCLEETGYLFIQGTGLSRMSLSSFLFRCAMRWQGWMSERMLECGEGSTWESWPDTVLSKNYPSGFCAMGDVVSVCSLAFLDGPTGLCLKFTVVLHLQRQRERNQNRRWSRHHWHPHAVAGKREGHSAGLPVRTVCVLLFRDTEVGGGE